MSDRPSITLEHEEVLKVYAQIMRPVVQVLRKELLSAIENRDYEKAEEFSAYFKAHKKVCEHFGIDFLRNHFGIH